ncbi:MAG: hypothetical protein M1371_02985 [Actinobacteria bacterium]|nr:hypothetical protein [Actinomycetota bacterium]
MTHVVGPRDPVCSDYLRIFAGDGKFPVGHALPLFSLETIKGLAEASIFLKEVYLITKVYFGKTQESFKRKK